MKLTIFYFKHVEHQLSLCVYTNNLARDFGILVMKIQTYLSESATKDNLKQCKAYCIQLKISDDDKTSLFNPHKIEEIKHCTNIEELFEAVKDHWSWDNYSILTDFIEICDSVEAKVEVERFERKLASYKGLNFIFSTPEIEPPQDYIRFYAHINKRYVNFTIEDYKEVKYHVFALLAINHNVATHHIKGWFQSLHLEWYVTSQAVPHMMKMALQNKNDIIKEHIIGMQIGKRSILDDQVATYRHNCSNVCIVVQ